MQNGKVAMSKLLHTGTHAAGMQGKKNRTKRPRRCGGIGKAAQAL